MWQITKHHNNVQENLNRDNININDIADADTTVTTISTSCYFTAITTAAT